MQLEMSERGMFFIFLLDGDRAYFISTVLTKNPVQVSLHNIEYQGSAMVRHAAVSTVR